MFVVYQILVKQLVYNNYNFMMMTDYIFNIEFRSATEQVCVWIDKLEVLKRSNYCK